MKWRRPEKRAGPGILLVAFLLVVGGCDGPESAQAEAQEELLAALRSLTPPESHHEGAALFAERCVQCHGPLASGSALGPPLVHTVYRPAHHADAAFQLAVLRGVRAHHWGFGDMPAQPEVTPEMVTAITGYIRWLQREVGIE